MIRQPGIIPMLLQIQLTSAEFSSHVNKAMRDLSESKVENNTVLAVVHRALNMHSLELQALMTQTQHHFELIHKHLFPRVSL